MALASGHAHPNSANEIRIPWVPLRYRFLYDTENQSRLMGTREIDTQTEREREREREREKEREREDIEREKKK